MFLKRLKNAYYILISIQRKFNRVLLKKEASLQHTLSKFYSHFRNILSDRIYFSLNIGVSGLVSDRDSIDLIKAHF